MYGLPSDFEASQLVGCVLEYVLFSENNVVFYFSDYVYVKVESSFAYSSCREVLDIDPIRVPVRESNVMQLLGGAIESAHASAEGTLVIRFAGGRCLAFFDDSKEYECYVIGMGEKEIIV